MIGRGGEQLHSFLAFLLLAAGEGFGGGVDPQTGGAIAWDGKGAAQVGEGEEGGPVGGAEPGDPSLAGEAVLPMKLRVEVGDLFIGLCAALLIVFGACLWPPKVVPKEADIWALLVLLAQAHPVFVSTRLCLLNCISYDFTRQRPGRPVDKFYDYF